jgi:signal peptidase I
VNGAPPSLAGRPSHRAVQRTLKALWLGVIPALLAGLVLRYLVPRIGSGAAGVVILLAHRAGIYLGLALFFLFAGMARHWRYWLPGGRYATALPAHLVSGERDGDRLREWERHVVLHERLRSRAVRERVRGSVAPDMLALLDASLGDLRAAIEGGDAVRAGDAHRAVESIAGPAVAVATRRESAIWVAVVVAAAAIPLSLRAWVVQPYQVVSTSMVPTLEPEDSVAGNKLAYPGKRAPARGEAIVFRSSSVALERRDRVVPDVLVKRVIGLPGDRIFMRGAAPVINGWPVPGCDAGVFVYVQPDDTQVLVSHLMVEFLGDRAYLALYPARQARSDGEYTVQPGEVFVLGDNRGNSLDSRSYGGGRGGGVPLAGIEARAQWFLAGTDRSGEADWKRILRPLDVLRPHLRFDGSDLDIDGKIAQCLKNRPGLTSPPPPGEGPSAQRGTGG